MATQTTGSGPGTVRVAVAQTDPTIGQNDKNAARAAEIIGEAAANGARLGRVSRSARSLAT